jgi:hypothetical protein
MIIFKIGIVAAIILFIGEPMFSKTFHAIYGKEPLLVPTFRELPYCFYYSYWFGKLKRNVEIKFRYFLEVGAVNLPNYATSQKLCLPLICFFSYSARKELPIIKKALSYADIFSIVCVVALFSYSLF